MKLPAEKREHIDDIKVEYEKFFEVSLDMFCISGFDGYFKKVNSAFVETLGFSSDELCTHSYLYFIHPDDIERTKQEVERQLKTKQRVLSFENRYRHKNGSYRWLSWKSAPVGNFMYAAARDITDEKMSNERLKVAKDAVESVNKELEAFSYSVAHDLRAPVRSISSFATLVLNDQDSSLSADGKSHLTRVINATKKMALLIDGLLNLSRVTRQEIQTTRVSLSAAAHESAEMLRQSDLHRRVDFVIAENIMADGDPILLKTVISNLFENAWKYTSKSSQPARIEFGTTEKDGHRVYFVKDNGAGFDMRFVHKLFGIFQRLHTDREFEGTGIGLATVHRIISRHGGRIWATGAVGTGATFYFTTHNSDQS